MSAKTASRELLTRTTGAARTAGAHPGPDGCPKAPAHGALTHAEAAELLGRDELAAALREGRWVRPWPGVVVPEHRARDPLTRAGAALLRAGPHAVLSGATAVSMHGCTAAEARTLEVTIPYDRQMRSLPGLSVRQARVREPDVQRLDGLRVFALDVALTELLCTGPQRVALACLEQALTQLASEGGETERFRRLVAERLSRRMDRRGTRRAAGLLELAWTGPPSASSTGPGGRFERSSSAHLGEAS